MSAQWCSCVNPRTSAVDIDSTYRLVLTKHTYDWRLWITDAAATVKHISVFGEVLHEEDLMLRGDAQRYAEYVFSQWKAGTW